MPLQNFPYLRVSQLSKGSARNFHARLLIDQAHCLRDPKGTAPASGHGSIDGPKGRERVRALVRDRLRALCQTPRRRQCLFFLPVLGVLMRDEGLRASVKHEAWVPQDFLLREPKVTIPRGMWAQASWPAPLRSQSFGERGPHLHDALMMNVSDEI